MNREDIIRMAREGKSVVEQVHAYVSTNDTDFTSESMAAMVRDFIAAEREECAKVCEKTDDGTPYNLSEECAAAIRARK